MKIELKGNTYQEGTPTPESPQQVHVVSGDNTIEVCGKNLFNPQKVVSDSNNAKTFITSDNKWICFETGATRLIYYPVGIKENTQYTLKMTIKNGTNSQAIGFSFYYTDGTYTSFTFGTISDTNEHTLTTTSENGKTLSFIRSSWTVGKEAYIKIEGTQLVEGQYTSSTMPTYEPYTGESYPISLGDIELCKIETYQDKIDKSSGKNSFNPQEFITAMSTNYREIKTTNGVEFICLGRSQSTTTTYTYSLNCKENTQYTLSFKYISSSCSLTVSYSDGTSSSGLTPNQTTLTNVSYTSEANKTITGISLYCGGWYASGNKLEITQIMLNEGTTALPYEPYGTRWYVKKEVGKLNLSSIPFSAFNPSTNNTTRIVWYSLGHNYTDSSDDLCNMLPFNINVWDLDVEGFSVGNSSGYVIVRINKSTIGSTEQEATTWLSNNDLIIYAPLATPTYTLIEDNTLIEQLESMKKSKEGQTNISQENNDNASIMSAVALSE